MKKLTAISFLLFSALFIMAQSAEELREKLQQHEVENPLEYLKVEATISPNKVLDHTHIFSSDTYKTDGYNIKGTIQNTATIAKYKDAVVTISFYTKTETLLAEEDHTIYEFLEPNKKAEFTIKVYPPENYSEWKIIIKSAVAVEK